MRVLLLALVFLAYLGVMLFEGGCSRPAKVAAPCGPKGAPAVTER